MTERDPLDAELETLRKFKADAGPLIEAARTWLWCLDEGTILVVFRPGCGWTPGDMRQRINELEKGLEPFRP